VRASHLNGNDEQRQRPVTAQGYAAGWVRTPRIGVTPARHTRAATVPSTTIARRRTRGGSAGCHDQSRHFLFVRDQGCRGNVEKVSHAECPTEAGPHGKAKRSLGRRIRCCRG
jgi:hypothetical protein